MIDTSNFTKPGQTDGHVQVTPELIAELQASYHFNECHKEGDFAFNIPQSMWEEFLGDLDFG